MVAVRIENEKAIKAEVTALNQRMEREEQMMRELLRGVPAAQAQGEIVYSYASAKSIAELRQLKGLNMSHFVLALEVEVYQDDTSELELLVENRIRTEDRVLFIQQCLFKYYEIPSHLREGTKESLNSRVRRQRKTNRDQELARNWIQSRPQGSQERRVPLQQRGSSYRPSQDTYYFDGE